MSIEHPIIAITGSSGAGTSTVRQALTHIFDRIEAKAAYVAGDCFHRYDRAEMGQALVRAKAEGTHLSHFGPEGNLFDRQYELFRSYGLTGTGVYRHYIHNEEEAVQFGAEPGTFTPWEAVPPDSDVLCYEGLHGGVVTDAYDMAAEVDLLIGVAPTINLEWIQKVHRDMHDRGVQPEAVVESIQRRMYDYMHYILPQFERTSINFQRIPLVDTSNPLMVREVPTADQSQVLIHFLEPKPTIGYKLQLKELIEGAFLTGFNTLIIPGGKMTYALELILTERILELLARRRDARKDAAGR